MPPLDEFSLKTLNEIISAGVSSKLVYEGSVCDAYPCWNDGICVETNRTTDGYLCLCNQMFTGVHCEIKTADNCTNTYCPAGMFCSPSTSACLPVEKFDLYPLCDIAPCLNGGICIEADLDRRQCLCPITHSGLLCETAHLHRIPVPMAWNALQFLFLFAVLFLLASALLTFCYGGNYGCYVNWPRRPRYSKWNGELELSWDDVDEEEEDEDLIGGRQLYRRPRPNSMPLQSPSTSSDKNCFELKSKPLRISSTAETFITYNDSPTTSSAMTLPNGTANPVGGTADRSTPIPQHI